MANKTFVAKNGLTANTANVFMSQLSGTLTPTAAGAIVIVDGTGQLGTRTEAQILSDIGAISSSSAVDSVTAGNGLTGGGTEGDVTVTLGTPATLTVSGTNTVGGTDHQHAITTSADTSSGTQAILASDSSGDLKVANFQTGAALTVGTDLVVKDDVSLDSDGAVLGFGDDNEITLTHVHDSGLTLNGASKINFGDAGTFIHQSADGVLDLVSDTELELNATTIDINGAVEMSGVVTVATGIIADAQDGAYLGSTTKQFSDLYLADGAQILFGDDSEVTLTHNADKGLTLKHTATAGAPTLTLAAGDTNIAVNDVIGAIDFVAPDEGTGTDAITTAGSIRVISEGDFAADNNASKMSFMLGSSGAASEVLSVSSGGNLTVSGNLVVSGTTTTVSSTTIEVNDPLLFLAQNNTGSDAVDIGFFGTYDTSGSQDLFAGLFRDANDGKFRLFKDSQAEPTTTVNTGATGYAVATLVANVEGTITGNVTGDVTGNADTATALATARNIGGVSFDGTAAITPNEITVADESSDATCFMLFATAATGAVQPKTGTNVTFNSGTGLLTATGFSGNLTGTLQTAAQGNITSVGALDGGSITSGFGAIDTGSSTITTTGAVSGGSFKVANEGSIGSAGDTNAILVGASGTVAITQNETLIGASNSSVGVAMTKAFSGTIAGSATAAVLTFKAMDGTSGTIVTGASNFMGAEVIMSLQSGTNFESKKFFIHHNNAVADDTDIFITEFAALGTEIGETVAVAVGDADGTSLTSNSDKHVQLKLTNPSGTDNLVYSGVAHLVEVPGDS